MVLFGLNARKTGYAIQETFSELILEAFFPWQIRWRVPKSLRIYQLCQVRSSVVFDSSLSTVRVSALVGLPQLKFHWHSMLHKLKPSLAWKAFLSWRQTSSCSLLKSQLSVPWKQKPEQLRRQAKTAQWTNKNTIHVILAPSAGSRVRRRVATGFVYVWLAEQVLHWHEGCLPFTQKFRKFRLEYNW